MVAVEFTSPNPPGAQFDPVAKPGSPKNLASRVVKACVDKGLLILTTSAYEVVRFIPPLNISKQDLKKGMEIFGEAVRQVVKEG
jgi:4-aminobutyrate aminotransferase